MNDSPNYMRMFQVFDFNRLTIPKVQTTLPACFMKIPEEAKPNE